MHMLIYINVYTHISIDQNIKPNSIGFDQSAVVRPILHLIIFGKPVQNNTKHASLILIENKLKLMD